MTSEIPRSAAGPEESGAALAALAATMLCHAPMFIGLYDAQFRATFLNAAGRKMIGLSSSADIAAYRITDFISPRHRRVVEEHGLPAMLRDGFWESELCVGNLTEPSRQAEAYCCLFLLRNRFGHQVGAAAVAIDISVCRQAKQSMRNQHRLLASVLEYLPLGVGIYSHHGDLRHSNQRMCDYIGLARPVSSESGPLHGWRDEEADKRSILLDRYAGAGALLSKFPTAGSDNLHGDPGAERWMRTSAVPFRLEDDQADGAAVLVQDVDDLRRAAERIATAETEAASHSGFVETTLSSIPDFVYAFDSQRRFVYANRAMLALFGLSADDMLGRNFSDLGYPSDLADRLNAHIDRVFTEGVTVADEVFFRTASGYGAYFSFLWGPVRTSSGSVELVVGVSRDTTQRRVFEDALMKSETRLRAATELVGLGVYSWDPVTGALEWDERVRAMWGLPPDFPINMEVYEAGIHPDDLARVRDAITACVDPAGDGHYSIEYRVIGRDDGVMRHIATSGRTTFDCGRAVGFIGAAIDVTAQRRAESTIRESEAQFRGFAEHSSNLIWIGDLAADNIIYRSAAFERIWGIADADAPTALADWLTVVHPDDRWQVESALATARSGEVVQYEYRIIRPADGTLRWLRDTSFPIRNDSGTVIRIGGIAEDVTPRDSRQAYIVSTIPSLAKRMATLVRGIGYRTRMFESAAAFLDIAPVLAPGCVLVDLRGSQQQGLSVPRELKVRSIALPTILINGPNADVASAVAAMKAGAVDYLAVENEESFRIKLANALAECHGAARPAARDERASSRVARLTPRERDVLQRLVEGGTNKTIGKSLGISPRTVELHRAQVMSRLGASSLTKLLQIALVAGITPATGTAHTPGSDTV